jgi:predicted nuclease of restriction endonuclease-like (RecB) superfamily
MVSINDESNIILLEDLRKLIDSARKSVAKTVNSTMTLLYWQIGKRIYTEILNENRAEYGKQIVINISEELTLFYGKGWSPRQIRYCLQIAELFPEFKIWHTMCAKLSWSHIRLLIRIEDALKRDFFTELCKLENWSVRQLQEKSEKLIKNDLKQLQDEDKLSPDLVFRDPYFLDFLGLTSEYSEKDLESAILVELQKFITELGQDFGFLARQKRISIDNRDYYIDLLFYHRRLKSLVVIDLKLGDFEAGYKGQMELYLRYLEKYEQVEGENSPIGLILCAGKNAEHIELLGLDKSNIRLAEYLTQLPPKEILQAKLHQSLEIARHRLHTQEQ